MDTKKTIMVVDDNPDIITIVKTILEGRGYNVFSASSGPELLNMLTTQKPDLIILDIMMPEMDGLEVLTRLKGKTETSTIPVILLTAKVQYEDVLGGYKLGADYYITKPFTSTQLVNGFSSVPTSLFASSDRFLHSRYSWFGSLRSKGATGPASPLKYAPSRIISPGVLTPAW